MSSNLITRTRKVFYYSMYSKGYSLRPKKALKVILIDMIATTAPECNYKKPLHACKQPLIAENYQLQRNQHS